MERALGPEQARAMVLVLEKALVPAMERVLEKELALVYQDWEREQVKALARVLEKEPALAYQYWVLEPGTAREPGRALARGSEFRPSALQEREPERVSAEWEASVELVVPGRARELVKSAAWAERPLVPARVSREREPGSRQGQEPVLALAWEWRQFLAPCCPWTDDRRRRCRGLGSFRRIRDMLHRRGYCGTRST
jgi:hypothetical protein